MHDVIQLSCHTSETSNKHDNFWCVKKTTDLFCRKTNELLNMSPLPQISSDILLKSIDNLINICENASSGLSRHRDKVNSILNDLNSIEFKYVHSLDIFKVSF